ncbi:MAG: Polbeta protein [Candidatus Brocadiaceae bacterium]|nr:Polbeta protein [Candidatus Brocadiaceae bacterium]
MAFLFGSYAKATAHRESDVDIAVYFRPKTKYLEWEEFDVKYDAEDFRETVEDYWKMKRAIYG